MAEPTYPYALAAAGFLETHTGADHGAETPDP